MIILIYWIIIYYILIIIDQVNFEFIQSFNFFKTKNKNFGDK